MFLFLNFDMVPWNSTFGRFAFIRQSKWVGVIEIKTKRTQIHSFLSDIPVSVSKSLITWLSAHRDRERIHSERVKATYTAYFDILTFLISWVVGGHEYL